MNTQIVNIANEHKLIYIGSYLHKLMGFCIEKVKHRNPDHNSYVTYPIVDDNWRVIDDEYPDQDIFEFGFDFKILGREGDTLHINHPVFEEAIEEAVGDSHRTMADLFREASSFGIKFTCQGVKPLARLYISQVFDEGIYSLSNVDFTDIDMVNNTAVRGTAFPFPTLYFDPKAKESYSKNKSHIFCVEDLIKWIQKILTDYAVYFKQHHIRLSVLPEDPDCTCRSTLDLSTDMLNLLSHIEDEVNTHMEMIDENL